LLKLQRVVKVELLLVEKQHAEIALQPGQNDIVDTYACGDSRIWEYNRIIHVVLIH
jgi:hypothetical protein